MSYRRSRSLLVTEHSDFYIVHAHGFGSSDSGSQSWICLLTPRCWSCHLAYCGILKEMSLEELVEFILYSWIQADSSHGEGLQYSGFS